MSRIRFAPLPDPHVLTVHDADDDDNYDVEPLDTELSKSPNPKLLFPFVLPGGKKPCDTSSSASSSMHSLTPTQSIDSTTPPTRKSRFLRMFRSKEKDTSLSRFSSLNSFGSTATNDSLFRTQSTTSNRGSVRSTKTSNPRRPTTSDGLLAPLHTQRKQPQLMLNGRVYGERKNLFASAPDTEPEFVEWGYGGMGSVKNQREVGGRMWGKVQGNTGMTGADDEDDGGGMGWVKRRKEERERKAKEEAEKKAQEAAELEAQEEHDTRAITVPLHDDENDEEDDDSPVEDSPDDEDVSPTVEPRKTSLGAGVEKVSRHKI
ncbi:hypothetical protein CPB85DRAFT_1481891 [Mucidula mucida]|nr:hypothetical protein CPB85DRAFT_1481891 [Mucidula mucida]